MEYGEAIKRPNAGGIKQAAPATENEVHALLSHPHSCFLSFSLALKQAAPVAENELKQFI